MKCSEFVKSLESKWPKEASYDWDNPGLLVGKLRGDIYRILVTLDLDDGALERAVKLAADIVVSHHPLVFSSIKRVTDDDVVGRRIISLISHNIAAYALHTNFDVITMCRLNGQSLALKDPVILDETFAGGDETIWGIGQVGDLPEEMDVEKFAGYVKEALKIEHVRVYPSGRAVKRVAISGGAGKSSVRKAIESGADAIVTGDIDHHTGIDAAAAGLTVVDAGHYGTEKIFVDYMVKDLKEMFPDAEIYGYESGEPCLWY